MITAKDFLDSADQIRKDASKEVDYRNSASRSFYAAFHLCRVLAEKTGNLSIGASHEKVIDTLKNDKSNNKTQFKTFGNILRELKTIRVDADYHINEDFARSESERAIGMARKLITEIQSIG